MAMNSSVRRGQGLYGAGTHLASQWTKDGMPSWTPDGAAGAREATLALCDLLKEAHTGRMTLIDLPRRLRELTATAPEHVDGRAHLEPVAPHATWPSPRSQCDSSSRIT